MTTGAEDPLVSSRARGVLLGLLLNGLALPARAEDGYELWLRYRPVADEPDSRNTAQQSPVSSSTQQPQP